MSQRQSFERLIDIYENRMLFNRFLGVQVRALSLHEVNLQIDMKEAFIGNPFKRTLHGGVTSSFLDLTGGLIASVELMRSVHDLSDELWKRIAKIGTIDLRVDYLRAGTGNHFTASGSVLRTGNKVAVVRTEMHNDSSVLIAAGTGTYLIG